MEKEKIVANEIFGAFQHHADGICTYDRALEDAARIIIKHCSERPIVGYCSSGTIHKILREVSENKKRNETKSYMFDVALHQNEMMTIERILEASE